MKKPAHLAPELEEIWEESQDQFLPTIGSIGLEAVCQQIYRMRQAKNSVKEDGVYIQNKNGEAVPHPSITIERQAATELRAWIKQFGK